MAFDAMKKIAEGTPDYLEVPVAEDGLLEKATAVILHSAMTWRKPLPYSCAGLSRLHLLLILREQKSMSVEQPILRLMT